MATYAQFKHVELYKIGHGKNRVPNAPKSSIGEIFGADATDGGSPIKNGSASRPRVVRDTPTRPRDTHTRLFGQAQSPNVSPMVTDTIRSHIQFGEAAVNGTPNGKAHMNGTPNGKAHMNGTPNGKANGHATPNGKAYGNGHVNGNGYSPASSPTKSMFNGNPSPTPSRATAASYAKRSPMRNPVTGEGIDLPKLRPHYRNPQREGNPITGAGYKYKSMNGQINTVTSINGFHNILHNRVPPGGYSSGLW